MLKRKLSLILALILAFSMTMTSTAQLEAEDLPEAEEVYSLVEAENVEETDMDIEDLADFSPIGFDPMEELEYDQEEFTYGEVKEINSRAASRSSRAANAPHKIDYDTLFGSAGNRSGSPGTAIRFPINNIGTITPSVAGQQIWFDAIAPASGKTTVHMLVPQLSTHEYDLYLYRLEPSTGVLTLVRSGTHSAYVNEHVSMNTSANERYFFMVHAYRGANEAFVIYNIHSQPQSADQDNIDNAINVGTSIKKNDTLRDAFDRDYYRFNVPSNCRMVIRVDAHSDLEAIVYNTNKQPIGALDMNGEYILNLNAGTNYLRIYNPQYSGGASYTLFLNSVTSGNIGHILGRDNNNQKIAYTTTNDKLWVSSSGTHQQYNVGLAGLGFVYENQFGKTTVQQIQAPNWAIFGSYSSNLPTLGAGGIGGSASNALLLVNSRTYVSNIKYIINGPALSQPVFDVPANTGGYVIDLSRTGTNDTPRIDFWANHAHGFMNGWIDTYSSNFTY